MELWKLRIAYADDPQVNALIDMAERQSEAIAELHEHYCHMMADTRAFEERRILLHAWKAEYSDLLSPGRPLRDKETT